MQPDGSVINIPTRGLEFLREYIGRLRDYDPSFPGVPNIAPIQPPLRALKTANESVNQAASAESTDTTVLPASPLILLQRPKEQQDDFILPANLALPCNYSRRLIQGLRRERGCPFAGRGVFQIEKPEGVK